ncbi:transglutaminase [Chryseobacterium sp. Leaf404]|uniref:transglutaminase-like domain-containing protein n=1 Tax=unclassified Chryseobacterium TaxID=2593645 RepID=UPI0006F3D87B|nr:MULTISPECIES: transglutaminase domain-containing protein [unclassified Chryseobacterium]KQT18401.1 transglutaminase [Chryseobacterium sp. Leaf404]
MKKLLVTFCCVSAVFLYSQKHEFLKMPKFTIDDLKKSKSAIDVKAPAEILYRSVHYRIDDSTGDLLKNIAYRIKVYDKDKVEDWMNLEISLYDNNNGSKEALRSMKAVVYNLENDKIAETKVDKSSKFKSKENKYTTVNKFAFPNIKNGSVIEYRYEVSSPFAYQVPMAYIELDIPSEYTEYVFESPVEMSYHIDFTGSLSPKHRKVEEAQLYGRTTKTYRFAFEDLKAFKTENFVKNSDNYRTKVRAELHSTYFNNSLKMYTASWEDIRKKLWDDEDFGNQYRKDRAVKEIMPSDIAGEKEELKRAQLIHSFVKNNYTWNESNGYFAENGVKNLIKTKTGNCGDLNLMLLGMLRSSGIKAYPILVSTIKNGNVNITFPNVGNFNYVIICAEISGKSYLFDATSRQSSEGILPSRVWNNTGLILRDDKAEVISLNNIKMSYNYLTTKAKINENGIISGVYEDRDVGLFAMNAKEHYDENQEKYSKQYKENFSVDFTDIKSDVLENGDFESKMSFSSENLIDNVGKKKIFNPLLFLHSSSNDFNQIEERKYMIDFISPVSKIKTVEIEIPEGYEVEDLPKSKKIVTEDKEISYSYIVEKNNNKIKVTSQYKIASADYPKEYYPAFKQIWKVISDSESQVMSLVKTQ